MDEFTKKELIEKYDDQVRGDEFSWESCETDIKDGCVVVTLTKRLADWELRGDPKPTPHGPPTEHETLVMKLLHAAEMQMFKK